MQGTRFGTVHERYLGSGIVQLSRLPQACYFDSNFHLSSQCRREKIQLEELFKRRACVPWLPAHRVRAETTEREWTNKTVESARRLDDGISYHCIHFREDTAITVTHGIAMLELIRSSEAAGVVRTFHPLELHQRWWVLDFFCIGE